MVLNSIFQKMKEIVKYADFLKPKIFDFKLAFIIHILSSSHHEGMLVRIHLVST
jgi:hypothetical protein